MTLRRSDPRPPEAWWSETDREWVLGDRDEEGRLTGWVRYWDVDGRFICESELVAGRPHGVFRRFDHPGGELSQEGRYVDGRIDGVRRIHRPSTPVAEPPGQGYGTGGPWRDAAESVRVYECVYDGGDLIQHRLRRLERLCVAF
ncbi:toxin-antitoxin system YwqK family antitoxin [Streptomyces sp. NPDC102437]|uniref:toxin-antitoxin system YwqK family antitoxin n=1 Tax=Streptomyces sp. NPDC102437 TaxID=3366175 RepID=UPI0038210BB6